MSQYCLCQSSSYNASLVILLTLKSSRKRKSNLEKWCRKDWFSLAGVFSTCCLHALYGQLLLHLQVFTYESLPLRGLL